MGARRCHLQGETISSSWTQGPGVTPSFLSSGVENTAGNSSSQDRNWGKRRREGEVRVLSFPTWLKKKLLKKHPKLKTLMKFMFK